MTDKTQMRFELARELLIRVKNERGIDFAKSLLPVDDGGRMLRLSELRFQPNRIEELIRLCQGRGTTYLNVSAWVPTAGSVWRHANGFEGRVDSLANLDDTPKYPLQVIYRGLHNNKLYVRPANDWHRSMKRVVR